MIPNPRFRVNRFANCAEQTERREIVFFHPLVAPPNERANRGRRGVENVNPILLDDFPEPVRLRPIGCAFIHECRRAVGERTVNDITVASHPSHVRGAPKNIFVANVEDVFRGGINSNEVTASRVQNPFWFPGRAAGVKNVERMFAVERRRRTIVVNVFQLAMPPNVAALFHVNFIVGALENNHAFDRCPAAERVIHIFFERNNSTAAIAAVRGDQGDCAAVMDPVTN